MERVVVAKPFSRPEVKSEAKAGLLLSEILAAVGFVVDGWITHHSQKRTRRDEEEVGVAH